MSVSKFDDISQSFIRNDLLLVANGSLVEGELFHSSLLAAPVIVRSQGVYLTGSHLAPNSNMYWYIIFLKSNYVPGAK